MGGKGTARCLAAVSYSRPHLIRIPIPSPPFAKRPSLTALLSPSPLEMFFVWAGLGD